MSVDYEIIRHLVKLVEKSGLSELSIEENGVSITIKAEQRVATVAGIASASAAQIDFVEYDEIEEMETPLVEAANAALFEIRSPMVGVFYRRPSPDSPAFVDVEDTIEVGQTIGLIEAMKVFSEVPSEVAGRIVALPAESGKLVSQGDVLAVIDTSEVIES
jgi:acetyl-CoA carboxylase biotin carboxyl carrier protein